MPQEKVGPGEADASPAPSRPVEALIDDREPGAWVIPYAPLPRETGAQRGWYQTTKFWWTGSYWAWIEKGSPESHLLPPEPGRPADVRPHREGNSSFYWDGDQWLLVPDGCAPRYRPESLESLPSAAASGAQREGRCSNCDEPLSVLDARCIRCGWTVVGRRTVAPLGMEEGWSARATPPKSPLLRLVVGLSIIAVALTGCSIWLLASVNSAAARSAALSDQLASARAQLADLGAKNRTLQQQADHPDLAMWNSCGSVSPCSLDATGWREGSVPDTFRFTAHLKATQPIALGILTYAEFVTFRNCVDNPYRTQADQFSITSSCLWNDALNHDSHRWWQGSSIDASFDGATGCAEYLGVIVTLYKSPAVITPDVRVTYDPASSATGVCAGS